MTEAVIAFVALAVLMLGGQYFLRRRHRRFTPLHVEPSDGAFILRPPLRNAIMLGITALIPGAVFGLVTVRTWQLGRTSTLGFAAGIIVTLVTVGVAVYFFASGFKKCLVVRDTGIERVGMFSRRVLGWTSIAKIGFNPLQHWFFVTAADGSHLWLPADLAGMGDFAVVALRRIPPTVLQSADPMVREVLDELAEGVQQPAVSATRT